MDLLEHDNTSSTARINSSEVTEEDIPTFHGSFNNFVLLSATSAEPYSYKPTSSTYRETGGEALILEEQRNSSVSTVDNQFSSENSYEEEKNPLLPTSSSGNPSKQLNNNVSTICLNLKNKREHDLPNSLLTIEDEAGKSSRGSNEASGEATYVTIKLPRLMVLPSNNNAIMTSPEDVGMTKSNKPSETKLQQCTMSFLQYRNKMSTTNCSQSDTEIPHKSRQTSDTWIPDLENNSLTLDKSTELPSASQIPQRLMIFPEKGKKSSEQMVATESESDSDVHKIRLRSRKQTFCKEMGDLISSVVFGSVACTSMTNTHPQTVAGASK